MWIGTLIARLPTMPSCRTVVQRCGSTEGDEIAKSTLDVHPELVLGGMRYQPGQFGSP